MKRSGETSSHIRTLSALHIRTIRGSLVRHGSAGNLHLDLRQFAPRHAHGRMAQRNVPDGVGQDGSQFEIPYGRITGFYAFALYRAFRGNLCKERPDLLSRRGELTDTCT